jgi:hypothetical protein
MRRIRTIGRAGWLLAALSAMEVQGVPASTGVSAKAATDPASGAVRWANSKLSEHINDGECLQFVHDAYQNGADVDIGSAETAIAYWNSHPALQHRGDLNPPLGALVFWNARANNAAGHVALGEGGDTVVSSYERSMHTIHEFSIRARNRDGYPYLGWLMPPGVAPGMGWATAPPVVTSGRNGDGRLETFYVGGDNAVWHRWQLSPSGRWSGESRLGGIARSVAVATNRDGRLEAFYIGTDNAVWHRWQVAAGGGWSGESRLGGWATSVAAARNRDGRLEVFYVGGDHAVWHRWQLSPGGRWSGESRLGGTAKDVAAATNADGRLEVFYVGTDKAVWHRWQLSAGGGWSGASRLDAGATSVTAARNRDGRLEVFYVGGDHAVWHRWQVAAGGWSPESRLGGTAKDVAAATNADGRLELFYAGGDSNVWHRWQISPGGGWSGEYWLGGWVKT